MSNEKEKEEVEETSEEDTEEKVSKKEAKKYEARIEELEQKLLETESSLNKELINAKAESTAWKNKYYEAYADLDNTRKVLEKDHADMIKYRAMGFIEKMLPMLDNFEMAFKTISDDPKIKNYQTGFKMIYRQLTSALTEEGVEVIEPKVGDEFDHNTMAAMSTVPGEEDNKVSSIYLKGYKLKDRLVRPAMVIVTKIEEKKQEDSQETVENKGE